MALSSLQLCNCAFIRLGEKPLDDLNGTNAQTQIVQTLYDPIRNALLSSYRWSFATKTAALSLNAQQPETPNGLKRFDLPVDCLTVISTGETGRSSPKQFKVQGQSVLSSSNALTLRYIFKPDEGACPPYFDTALIAQLAAEFSIPVTDSTSRTQMLFKMAEEAAQKARAIDAQQDSPDRIGQFNLIDVRG